MSTWVHPINKRLRLNLESELLACQRCTMLLKAPGETEERFHDRADTYGDFWVQLENPLLGTGRRIIVSPCKEHFMLLAGITETIEIVEHHLRLEGVA